MKRLGVIIMTAVTWAGLIAPVRAAEYSIDASHSGVHFKIKHLAISTVTGRFEKFSGTFTYDPTDTPAWAATAKIEAASVNTDIEKRDDHLRSADFFSVDTYPLIEFVSTGVEKVEKESFKLMGNLTLHGVTLPVALDVEVGGTVKDPWGNERAGFTATTAINRKDFGLTWGKALETGGLVVGETVRIILEIEGIQKKEDKKED